MKKIAAVLLIALLSSVTAFASVGYYKEGEHIGVATDINVQGNSTFDKTTVTMIANGHKDGVTTNVSTESNLTSAALAYGTVCLQAGSAKSIALANGSKGQMVTFILTTYDGATITITDDQVSSAVFTMTKTGWDDIALNSELDSVTLLYLDDTNGWVIVGNNGATIT